MCSKSKPTEHIPGIPRFLTLICERKSRTGSGRMNERNERHGRHVSYDVYDVLHVQALFICHILSLT